VSGLLFLVVLLFAAMTRASLDFLTGWTAWVAGLFAQAGIAEETLFRGYLFGRLRAGRSFRQAAVASMLPFVGVHLFLFFTMPWPLALASVILAVVISFPLAYLFELGGGTIWAPAILHFVIQGTVKVVSVGGGAAFPLTWMVASALLPLLVFLVPRGTVEPPVTA
jgi:membrane protease YdiL (CAAX protease family)